VKINLKPALNEESIREAIPMLPDDSRSSWPEASNPAGDKDAINAKGFLKENALAGESKSPLQEKKRKKSKLTVTPLPWNDPPDEISWDKDAFIRQPDGSYTHYLGAKDGRTIRLPESILQWHKKKYHWKEPDA
jgi:hypothetical protein